MFISRWQLSENILSFHTIFHELTLSVLSIYLNVLEINVEVKLYKTEGVILLLFVGTD
jgi:cytochrome bd-type quinol oxidase subunit 1